MQQYSWKGTSQRKQFTQIQKKIQKTHELFDKQIYVRDPSEDSKLEYQEIPICNEDPSDEEDPNEKEEELSEEEEWLVEESPHVENLIEHNYEEDKSNDEEPSEETLESIKFENQHRTIQEKEKKVELNERKRRRGKFKALYNESS